MMRDAVKEFIDREVWPNKHRFEQKDYDFTFELMRKAGELGFLGVGVPEAYGGLEMGFVSTMLVCDYFSGATGLTFHRLWSAYRHWYHANRFIWNRRAKEKVCA
jgi:alkylation response protein AidB-like acyl-CoA dehydrogenase